MYDQFSEWLNKDSFLPIFLKSIKNKYGIYIFFCIVNKGYMIKVHKINSINPLAIINNLYFVLLYCMHKSYYTSTLYSGLTAKKGVI